MKKILGVVAFSVASFVSAADKPAQGAYIGLGVGQSKIRLVQDDFAAYEVKDQASTAFKFYGGYKFNTFFALEGAYANLGKSTANVTAFGIKYSNEFKAATTSIAGVGFLPLGDSGAAITVKLGASRNSVDSKFSAASASSSGKDTKISTLYGVGIRFSITNNLGLRLEYENFGRAGKPIDFTAQSGTGRADLSLTSANLEYQF